MKVSKVIEALQQLPPDDEILVLWWEKNAFDYSEDDELILTDEAWLKVSNDFDKWDGAGEQIIGEWIADAVVEYAEVNEKSVD